MMAKKENKRQIDVEHLKLTDETGRTVGPLATGTVALWANTGSLSGWLREAPDWLIWMASQKPRDESERDGLWFAEDVFGNRIEPSFALTYLAIVSHMDESGLVEATDDELGDWLAEVTARVALEVQRRCGAIDYQEKGGSLEIQIKSPPPKLLGPLLKAIGKHRHLELANGSAPQNDIEAIYVSIGAAGVLAWEHRAQASYWADAAEQYTQRLGTALLGEVQRG